MRPYHDVSSGPVIRDRRREDLEARSFIGIVYPADYLLTDVPEEREDSKIEGFSGFWSSADDDSIDDEDFDLEPIDEDYHFMMSDVGILAGRDSTIFTSPGNREAENTCVMQGLCERQFVCQKPNICKP